MDSEIEQFPVEKRQIRIEEPPEMIFFDVDEETEEAEFIRIDDLFRLEGEAVPSLTGLMSFTFFPAKQSLYITGALSRLLRRTLILTAARIGITPERIRVRPLFMQWQIRLSDGDDPEALALEFRRDLEMQAKNIMNMDETDTFWSNSCLVGRADEELSDDLITRLAAQVRNE